MRKIFTTLLATITLLGGFMPVVANASTPNPVHVEIEESKSAVEDFLIDDTLMNKELVYYENANDIEPYVYVNEYGELALKYTISQDLFKKYQLDKLLEHFSYINNQVEEDNLVVNEDLSIEEANVSPLLQRAVQGRWTARW